MTVNVYAGPGTSAYASTLYTATVNGATSYVYGLSRTSVLPTTAWAQNSTVEMSWLKFTANETTTVAITRIAGAITSATVYPRNVATQSIVGGVLVLSMPTNTRLRVEVNGDRANVIHVFSDPLPRTIGTVTDWTVVSARVISSINTGTNVITCGSAHGWSAGQRLLIQTTGTLPTVSGVALSSNEAVYVLSPSGADLKIARTAGGTEIDLTGSGSGTITLKPADWTTGALYFGTGVHTITRGFKLSAGTRVYIDANAVVIGCFDWRGIAGAVTIEGPGTLLGDFATSETVQALSGGFAEKITYAMFLGYDGVNFSYNTEVQGITIARAPFYCDFVAVNRYRNVQLIAPWFYECNGLQVCSKSGSEPTSSIIDCFSFSGDDNLTLGEQVTGFNVTVSGCFLCTGANSNIHLNYWSQPDYGYGATFDEIDFLHIGPADVAGNATYPVYGGMTHIKAWSDGYVGEEQYGRFNCTFTNLRFWGPHASRWLMLANRDYPYDDYDDAQTRDQRGQIARFVFDGVTIEEEPGQIAVITGNDWLNTPHDITFTGLEIEGVPVGPANAADFFTWNVYPYHIIFEGRAVVTAETICNQALAAVSAKSRITSISPPDSGSVEAEQCSRYYNECIETLLEMHEWAFATKRVELTEAGDTDTTSWLFRYVVPADLCRAIAVLPEGVTHDRISSGGVRAPVEFVRELDADGVLRIYTNEENATLRYTAFVTNPNAWSPLFRQALVALLASKIAGPLWRGAEGEAVKQRCLRDVEVYLARAKVSDANQQKVRPEPQIASYMQNRRGGRTTS